MDIRSNPSSMSSTLTILAEVIAAIPFTRISWVTFPMLTKVHIQSCSTSIRRWVQKQGDFFVESPIILFAAIIWYLSIYKNGKYCTFPHAIELLNRRYEDVFPILTSYPELENIFLHSWTHGKVGQWSSWRVRLQAQRFRCHEWFHHNSTGWCPQASLHSTSTIPKNRKFYVSATIPTVRTFMVRHLACTTAASWNSSTRRDNSNHPLSLTRLPTIYFKGLDNLIATARSNKVAVCLGFPGLLAVGSRLWRQGG